MKVADAQPGVRAGSWTLLELPRRSGGRALVLCRCICGEEQRVRVDSLPPGPARPSTRCRSCQACTNVRDLRTTHYLYDTWRMMIRRCYDSSMPAYRWYGAVGVEVCERWRDEEDGFWWWLADLGDKPADDYTLDRIDPTGNYEPGNVRWSDRKTQADNTRANWDPDEVPF